MAGPRPQRPQATLHPGTRIPNRAPLSFSPAAPPLTMLSHLPDLLWLSLVIMVVERPTQCWGRGSLSLERGRIMGNFRVIDRSILPPLADLFSYPLSLQTACVLGTDCFDSQLTCSQKVGVAGLSTSLALHTEESVKWRWLWEQRTWCISSWI